MEIVNCPISENARLAPHHEALIDKEQTWTYQELDAAVQGLCAHLKERGVRENQRVAFTARTSPETICLFFALMRLGAVACPLSHRIPQGQIPKYLEALDPSHVLETESLPLIVSGYKPREHFQSRSQPLADPILKTLPKSSPIQLEQLATFLFTSGSSSSPKIVCQNFGNHYYNAKGAIALLQLETSSRWLLSLPLFHVSGIAILFRSFLCGSTVVLTRSSHTFSDNSGTLSADLPSQNREAMSQKHCPHCAEKESQSAETRFVQRTYEKSGLANAANFETIPEFKISHISLVPTQLYRMLKEPPESLERIRLSLCCILLGGAPIPPSLLDAASRASLPVFVTYGMTEMGSIIALSPMNSRVSGEIVPYRKVKIEKDHEIWVGGETLFQGYWNASLKTITRADQNGWYPTKDLGRWTAEHHLEVIGRKDRQFISGGENIHPEEIERALCSLPGIQQASVLPIEDAEFGKRPIAFLEDETGKYTLESIRSALKNILPSFMHPVRIFPYPPGSGMKPSLEALKLHLYTE